MRVASGAARAARGSVWCTSTCRRELGFDKPSAGRAPVFGRELEIPSARPARQDAEGVGEVALGVEPVQRAGGDERQDVRGRRGVIVRAEEEPRLPSHGDRPERALGGVIVEAKPAIIEEALERVTLPDDIAERGGERPADPAHAREYPFGPGEELVEHRARDSLPLGVPARAEELPLRGRRRVRREPGRALLARRHVRVARHQPVRLPDGRSRSRAGPPRERDRRAPPRRPGGRRRLKRSRRDCLDAVHGTVTDRPMLPPSSGTAAEQFADLAFNP